MTALVVRRHRRVTCRAFHLGNITIVCLWLQFRVGYARPMRALHFSLAAFVAVPVLLFACSASQQSAPGTGGASSGGTSSGASSGSTSGGTSSGSTSGGTSSGSTSGGTSSGSTSGGASSGGASSGGVGSDGGLCQYAAARPPSTGAAASGFYVPAGCTYGITPDASWGYQSLALDDASGTTDAPQRVRLGMGGGSTVGGNDYPDPTTTAAFTWETTTANAVSELKIGTSATALTQTQTGYSWTTTGSATTYMHEVHVCGLKPGTTYYYQVGGGASGGTWSATQSFTTVPTSGAVTFGFSGDSRDSTTVLQNVQLRMRDAAVNFQVYSGDFVDTGSTESEWTAAFNAVWKDTSNNFLTLGQQLIAPIAGNHEDDATDYFAAWPAPGSGSYAKTYYSFNAGNAHFVEFDDQQLAGGSPLTAEATAQMAWLAQDLAAADANRASFPFVVFVSHRGMYSTSYHANDSDVIFVRGQLAPLFDQYHVDVVFNGHDHEFERSYPLIAGKNAACTAPCSNVTQGMGTTYIISGGAGSDPYEEGQNPASWKVVGSGFGSGGSGTSAAFTGVYGIATMSCNTLTIKAYGLSASGTKVSDDTLVDSVTFTH